MRRPYILLLMELLLVALALLLLRSADWKPAPAEAVASTAAGRPIHGGSGRDSSSPSALSSTVLVTAPLNCRYGLSGWQPEIGIVRPDQWGAGWHLNFTARTTPVGEMEFLRMVRTPQDKYWDGTTWVYSDTFQVIPPLTDAAGGLGPVVRNNPGSYWVIGNEPDRGPNPDDPSWEGQDGIFPQLFAQAYDSVYQFIRERDPTARIGPAGLVQVTPARIQYLDLFVQSYQERYCTLPPLDFWTFHIYILPEVGAGGGWSSAGVALGTDPALAFSESGGDPALCSNVDNDIYCWADHDYLPDFEQQVYLMRQWMHGYGWQDRPLWLTEFSILYPFEDYDDPINPTVCYLQDEYGGCFTPPRVTRWLTATFEHLSEATDPTIGNPADQHRLVQRWAWFSLWVDEGLPAFVSNIITESPSYSLTMVGEAFRADLAAHPAQVNLRAHRARPAVAYSGPSGTATATLELEVVNNGDMALPVPVTVTWYADPDLLTPVASVLLSDLPGCATSAQLTATWVVSGTGVQRYWVRVDATDRLTEFDEGDNLLEGVVIVDPTQLYLPLIMRRSTP